MGEVYQLVSTFECEIKCRSISSDPLINLNALRVELALESVDMLVVRLEIEEANLVVLTAAAETLDDTLRYV